MAKEFVKNTLSGTNNKIDAQIANNIREFSKNLPGELSSRIKEFDKEWDIERELETNIPLIALMGLILAAVVLLFFLQHALQGWCPPIPLFRALEIRTRPEIDREKYALKAIRGDFYEVKNEHEQAKAQSALEAAKKI